MATREQIRYLQTARPFQPFRIKLAGGDTFLVTHPELASCSVNGRELVVHDDDVPGWWVVVDREFHPAP